MFSNVWVIWLKHVQLTHLSHVNISHQFIVLYQCQIFTMYGVTFLVTYVKCCMFGTWWIKHAKAMFRSTASQVLCSIIIVQWCASCHMFHDAFHHHMMKIKHVQVTFCFLHQPHVQPCVWQHGMFHQIFITMCHSCQTVIVIHTNHVSCKLYWWSF